MLKSITFVRFKVQPYLRYAKEYSFSIRYYIDNNLFG